MLGKVPQIQRQHLDITCVDCDVKAQCISHQCINQAIHIPPAFPFVGVLFSLSYRNGVKVAAVDKIQDVE